MNSIKALIQFIKEGNKRAVEHVTTCEIDTATPQDATDHLGELFYKRPRLNVYAYGRHEDGRREGFMNVGEEILLALLTDYNADPMKFVKELEKTLNNGK